MRRGRHQMRRLDAPTLVRGHGTRTHCDLFSLGHTFHSQRVTEQVIPWVPSTGAGYGTATHRLNLSTLRFCLSGGRAEHAASSIHSFVDGRMASISSVYTVRGVLGTYHSVLLGHRLETQHLRIMCYCPSRLSGSLGRTTLPSVQTLLEVR